jgi:phosphatidylglycerol:prolipoprotein diacylglycerol transferase
MADIGAPGLALGHAFGRIGCLFAGCCFGERVDASNPFAIVYPDYPAGYPSGLAAPPHVPLFGAPLLEAGFLCILSIILSILFLILRRPGLTTAIYLLGYGVWRFIIEYWRGDAIRGAFGPFTTSQYVSILLVICGLAILIGGAGGISYNYRREATGDDEKGVCL